ncbi:MAG: RNA polymerase sigma factor [Solirubrobacteraceae bacterium]
MSPRLSDLLLSSQSDERLVSLARAGHERAFAAIVERYRPELQALARRLCLDGRSEDVVQQAFLSAFAALRSGCEVRHLRGWLYRIVRNTAGRSDAPTFVPLDGSTASISVLEDVVQQRAMAMTALSEIARLPARQRQAMIGTALDGRARAEIASSMGLSEGAVRQLVHRARATLRGAVTALTPWPLARWLVAAGPDAPGPGELAAGAGAASSGGLALKLGALVASGTILTGAAVHLQARPAHRGDARAATSVHARRAVARAHPLAVASLAPPLLAGEGSAGPRPTGAATVVSRPVVHIGAPHRIVRHGRQWEAPTGPGSRSEGSRVGGHDDGRGDRTDRQGSSGGGDRHGAGGGAPTSSGTDFAGHGQDGGSRIDGVDGAGGSSGGGTGSGSDDGAAQMASDSHSLDSGVDGSGSHSGSGSGESSSSGVVSSSGEVSSSTSGSGSEVGSSSDGGSGSGTDGGTSGG